MCQLKFSGSKGCFLVDTEVLRSLTSIYSTATEPLCSADNSQQLHSIPDNTPVSALLTSFSPGNLRPYLTYLCRTVHMLLTQLHAATHAFDVLLLGEVQYWGC